MTGRKCRADLAIVGAGPAGCAAALHAVAAGLRVVVVEGASFPRARPGETLHPGVEPLFAQLGVLDRVHAEGFHRHRGVWVEWDAPRAFQSYGEDARGPWLGFQAERSRLDSLLLVAVRDAGVEVLQPCRVERVLHEGGRIVGLATSVGPIRAGWIADASGRHAWIARQIGLEFEHHSPPLRVRFGWRDSAGEDDLDGQPLFQAQPGGWEWRAPLGPSRCAWASLRLPYPDSIESHGDRAAGIAGIDLRWRLIPACAGPGYFLLGDAAATLDPSSSHGVLRALMSGILAGHLLEALNGGRASASGIIAAFRDWTHGQFTHDTVALRALWQRHPCEETRARMTASAPTRDPSAESLF